MFDIKGMIDLRGKTALITGGRRGLGKAMALGLAQNGVDIAIVSQSHESGDIEKQIKDMNRQFHYFQTDLSNRKCRDKLIKKVVHKFDKIDILINNAGVQKNAPLAEYSNDYWDMDISLMLTATFELSREISQIMIANGGGKIINMASVSSFQGARNIIGYSTVKHAIVGLTKCLANELAPCNINVNAIAPGIFKTDMAGDVFNNPERAELIRSRIPDGKFGELEDIIGPMLFLASDMSKHVHGHILLVDGGWMGR